MSCYIGEFYKVHYQPMLKKYAYHRILLCLLGKKEQIFKKRSFLNDNNNVMTERGYEEALEA